MPRTGVHQPNPFRLWRMWMLLLESFILLLYVLLMNDCASTSCCTFSTTSFRYDYDITRQTYRLCRFALGALRLAARLPIRFRFCRILPHRKSNKRYKMPSKWSIASVRVPSYFPNSKAMTLWYLRVESGLRLDSRLKAYSDEQFIWCVLMCDDSSIPGFTDSTFNIQFKSQFSFTNGSNESDCLECDKEFVGYRS